MGQRRTLAEKLAALRRDVEATEAELERQATALRARRTELLGSEFLKSVEAGDERALGLLPSLVDRLTPGARRIFAGWPALPEPIAPGARVSGDRPVAGSAAPAPAGTAGGAP